jgi:hypothetical protein
VKIALNKLKKKIENLFEESVPQDVEGEESKVTTMSDALKKGKEEEKEKSKMSLSDFGLELQSSEFSKYSATLDNIKFIFSDEEFRYDLYITIPLEEALIKDKEKDFSDKDIKKCFVKFKKYQIDNSELIGQISKNAEIANIDEDFIVELKIELDEEFGDESEKIEIETE